MQAGREFVHSPANVYTHGNTDLFLSDIVAFRLSPRGDIRWISTIPRDYLVTFNGDSPGSVQGFWSDGYIYFAQSRAYYASPVAWVSNNKLELLMNDEQRNAAVTTSTDKVVPFRYAKNIAPFLIEFSIETGEVSRKILDGPSESFVSLFPLGFRSGSSYYYPCRSVDGKDKKTFSFKLARLSFH